MQISILLAQQITQLFLILLMGYAVVKTGLLKWNRINTNRNWTSAYKKTTQK